MGPTPTHYFASPTAVAQCTMFYIHSGLTRIFVHKRPRYSTCARKWPPLRLKRFLFWPAMWLCLAHLAPYRHHSHQALAPAATTAFTNDTIHPSPKQTRQNSIIQMVAHSFLSACSMLICVWLGMCRTKMMRNFDYEVRQ